MPPRKKSTTKKKDVVEVAAEELAEAEAVEMQEIPVETPPVDHAPDEVVVDASKLTKVDAEWFGPYDEYTRVNTNYGQFGVPYGQRMKMTLQKVFDKKEGREVERMLPHYEPVTIKNDQRLAPTEAHTEAELRRQLRRKRSLEV